MPTSVGVGSYAVIAYGKRWYVAKVTDVQDGVFGVFYMTPCRGKWKWGRTDEGEVEESDIIMTLSDSQSLALLETSSRSKPRRNML